MHTAAGVQMLNRMYQIPLAMWYSVVDHPVILPVHPAFRIALVSHWYE